jgi:MFS family permease
MWVRHRSPAGRWVLLVTVLGSGLVVLDGTVVNVALPVIGQDLGASLTGLQWIVNAYTLTLAGLLLLGGALGDRYGRRRLFVVGILWFAVASLICAIAPNTPALIVARALQGIGAALLTPGSTGRVGAPPSDPGCHALLRGGLAGPGHSSPPHKDTQRARDPPRLARRTR